VRGDTEAALTSWLVLARPETWLVATAVGFLLGFLALAVPNCLFMLPIAVVAAPVLRGWRLRNSLLVGMCALAVIGAWSVRNQIAIGKPVFISTNVSSDLAAAIAQSDQQRNDKIGAQDSLDATIREERQWYLLETLRSLLRDPDAYLQRLVGYFHFHNALQTQSEQSRLKDIVMFFSYYTILLLAAGRFLLRKGLKFSSFDWWVALVYVSAAFFQALAFTRIRYRLPMDFLLIGCAGVTLHWVLQKLSLLTPIGNDDGHGKAGREESNGGPV
jgi:hypothetical protein